MKKAIESFLGLTIFALSLSAQSPETPKEQWYDRIGQYIQGTPWTFDGQLRTSHSKYLVQISKEGIMDEYLSPIIHTGPDIRLNILTDGSVSSMTSGWHYYGESEVGLGLPTNPANRTSMYVISGSYSGGAAYRLLNRGGFIVDLAPLGSLQVQSLVKTSNANNVFNLKASLGLDAWARVMYCIPWDIMPVNFGYSLQVPLFHLAYHPQYGQSYYDYISGDNRVPPRVYPLSFHNGIGLRQRLLVDLPLRTITLTIGVEHEYTRQVVNSTEYKYGAISLVLGISLDHLILSGNRRAGSDYVLSPLSND